MKLYEKLKQVREGLGLTIQDVANNALQIFGPKKAISGRTIYRIEKGLTHKFSSIEQICYGMGVQIPVVLRGTELEDRQIIRKKDRIDEFAGEGYLARVVSSPLRSFLALHIILEPKRKMPQERSPQGSANIAKLKITEIIPNGNAVLNELIKNDVLENISNTEVRLKPNLEQKKNLVQKITKDKFDDIWIILQQSHIYEKWIFVIKGGLICKIGEEKHVLKYMDSISFRSHITHQLENNGKIPCEFIQMINPKHF